MYDNNNYISSSKNVQEKSIKKECAINFLKMGFRIQLFHGINPKTNGCTCRKKDCSSPGKHPITRLEQVNKRKVFKAFFVESVEELKKELEARPNCNYCVETGKNLVVIDVDSVSELEQIKKEVPYLEETFTVKTKKGYHFYFRCDAAFKKIIKFKGMNVDILALGGLVLGPGSYGKEIVKNVKLNTLHQNEIQKFCGNQSSPSLSPTSNHKSNLKTFSSKAKQQLIKRFYAGETRRGEYFFAFSAVSFEKLRQSYKKGYSLQDHLLWSENIAIEKLNNPDLKLIKKYATNDYNNFNPKLSKNPYFQSLEKDLEKFSNRNKRFIFLCFKKGFKPSTRKKHNLDGYGMTAKEIREYVKSLFHAARMNSKLIDNISDYNLMTLLDKSFQVNKALKNRRMEGTRKQTRIWGVEIDQDNNLEKEIGIPNNQHPEECVVIGNNLAVAIKNKDLLNYGSDSSTRWLRQSILFAESRFKITYQV